MMNIDMGKVTRSWIKDGVKLQETDELYLAVGDDDDYHPENVNKDTEMQVIRDGEIVKRMWCVSPDKKDKGSHVGNKELNWKYSLLHLKINETGTDADVSASHNGLKDIIIPLGKATDIIRKLKSMLKITD